MKQILITLIMILSCVMIQAQDKEVWTPLFNGKDLKEWKTVGGNAEYHIEDECIVGTSILNSSNTFLVTRKNYSDFILEYEVKMDEGLNSGVQIRSHQREESKKKSPVYGYQIECEDSPRGWAGGIYDEGRNGWLYPVDYNPSAKFLFKKGEWNHYRIVAIGNNIKTYLNGKAVADLLVDWNADGFIGLQVHSIGDKSLEKKQIRWKNIRIITKNAERYLGTTTNIRQVNYLDNVLSDYEKKEGWSLLWDGKSNNGWRSAKSNSFPDHGWFMKDGVLSVESSSGSESGNGGDIITSKTYGDFFLEVDFNITKGANSGIKYLVDPELNKGSGSAIGCEYQILDDAVHPDAKLGVDGNRTLASLYDLIPADAHFYNSSLGKKRFNGIGKWNRARIEVKGNQVKHFLNGELVICYERNTQAFNALVKYSKYHDWANFGNAKKGHILLQDHGNEVKFRNIKIKELE